MKGIILAGGNGSRLYPLTKVITKQLQPIYDKPMIYYPLSLLMLGGINEVLLITAEADLMRFKQLLGDGSTLGISIEYKVQEKPAGIPEAFIIGQNFIQNDDVVLILGDNLFHGDIDFFRNALQMQKLKNDSLKARIFGYPVADPERYGVVEFERTSNRILSIEEKPSKPKSHYAIPGLYIFNSEVVDKALKLRPSKRQELEITDILNSYFAEKTLGLVPMTRGVAWLDMGTPKSFLEASSYIMAIEERQGLKIACLEEVALRMGFIDFPHFTRVVEALPMSPYRQYLINFLDDYSRL